MDLREDSSPVDLSDDAQFQEARLGLQCQAFISSDVGRYLVGRAEGEIEQYRDQMEQADPTNDAPGTAKVLLEIRIRRLLLTYLADAIHNGRAAEAEIREEDGR